jgi:hypothetical protein
MGMAANQINDTATSDLLSCTSCVFPVKKLLVAT